MTQIEQTVEFFAYFRRHRGEKFRHYRNDPGDPSSLSHNIVWSFVEDRDGYLWIGTDSGGLNRMDRKTGRCRHFLHNPANPNCLSHNTVRVL
ncbi:MAG: two-component regulator propeller domain-containing protein, partial [Candidatus Promineifilaceae bacterium]